MTAIVAALVAWGVIVSVCQFGKLRGPKAK
jgi:hypothetical protein